MHARSLAIDFLGQLNPKTGLIDLVLIEAQPSMDYALLEKMDPAAHRRVARAEEESTIQAGILQRWLGKDYNKR